MLVVLVLAACREQPSTTPDEGVPRGPEPTVAPAEATLRKLTGTEYLNSLTDLFAPGVVILPTSIEPDLVVEGLFSVGAGQAAISPLGVEQYEDAAYLVAGQVMADPALRSIVVPCSPSGTSDPGCSEAFVRSFGRFAWRRTLTGDEVSAIAGIADNAAIVLGDFWSGLEYGLAALLQSPNFLYRVEVGEDGAFTSIELASRMSYLLWSGPPDTELLDLGEEGSLLDPEVRVAQVERMLADPRARRGVRVFFDEMLGLNALDGLTKDPTLFVHWSDGVAPAAREETLATIEHLAFGDADFRDLLVTRTTFLDRSLAALYSVAAPVHEGFGQTELPADGPRAGLLGQVSFLALQAHSVSTSVTRRGKFVQTVLLCRDIPPPPANVDTSIPEPSDDAPTMRDRVASHLEDPVCASCHTVTDPIGLAFEHFDGIGRYRETDDGHPLDTSGDLDGVGFEGALGVGWAVHDHPDLPGCLSESVLRYAQGHVLAEPEEALATWHAEGFAEAGHRWQALLVDLVTAESFVTAGEEAR